MRDVMLSSVVIVVLAAATASGQSAPARIDVTKLGPQVGEAIANFRLQDQRGATWTRDALMGPHGLMLGYKFVELRLNSQPFLQVRPVRYPVPEIYVFKPLNERVEVFQKPFRLTQDVAFDASPDARKALASVDTMSITGVLEYQACDDTACYLSKAVPVSYSVRVRQLDTERAAPAGTSR